MAKLSRFNLHVHTQHKWFAGVLTFIRMINMTLNLFYMVTKTRSLLQLINTASGEITNLTL